MLCINYDDTEFCTKYFSLTTIYIQVNIFFFFFLICVILFLKYFQWCSLLALLSYRFCAGIVMIWFRIRCSSIVHACKLSCFFTSSSLLWTIAHEAPRPTGFFRHEYWSVLPFTFPGDLLDPGIELTSLMSPTLAARFLTTSITWEDHSSIV